MSYGRASAISTHSLGPTSSQPGQPGTGSKEACNELAGVLTLAEQYPQALAALDRVPPLGHEIPGDHYLRPSFSITA